MQKTKYLDNIGKFIYSGHGKKSYIYFILHEPFKNSKSYQVRVKIGHSVNPEKRLSNLQVGAPGNLFLWYKFEVNKENAASLESDLQAKFRWSKTRGEWFEIHPCIRKWIKAHKKYVRSNKIPDQVLDSNKNEVFIVPKDVNKEDRKELLSYIKRVKIPNTIAIGK